MLDRALDCISFGAVVHLDASFKEAHGDFLENHQRGRLTDVHALRESVALKYQALMQMRKLLIFSSQGLISTARNSLE